MIYDPERALWKPGRRSFLFMMGAGIVGAALPDVPRMLTQAEHAAGLFGVPECLFEKANPDLMNSLVGPAIRWAHEHGSDLCNKDYRSILDFPKGASKTAIGRAFATHRI